MEASLNCCNREIKERFIDIVLFLPQMTISKTLQETSLVMPKLMSVNRKVIRTFEKLRNIVECDRGDAFYNDDTFPQVKCLNNSVMKKNK